MDTSVATTYQPRARGQSFLDRHNAIPHDPEAPGESLARRKISRIDNTATDSSGQFRKPSLPASATRRISSGHQRQPSNSNDQSVNGVQRRPSFTSLQSKRASAVAGEHVRVPSGPREYPGASRAKRTTAQLSSVPSSTTINATRRRPSLLPSTSDSFLDHPELMRGAFGNPTDDTSPSTVPTSRTRDNSGSLDFLPAVNFDELQSSLIDSSTQLRSDLSLDDFPAIGGGRVLRSDTTKAKATAGPRSARPSMEEHESDAGSRRTSIAGESIRQRISDRAAKLVEQRPLHAQQATGERRMSIATRNKRQSIAHTDPQSAAKLQKPARPNLITSISSTSNPAIPLSAEEHSKSDLARSASLVKTRRTTMNVVPSASLSTSLNGGSASNSKLGKGKALLNSADDVNTPTNKSGGKPARAHTPSSSGNNRRQSMASGRMSGLGARTISPTDARRLKRMSMAPQQPPMPSSIPNKTPTPGEEVPPAPSTIAMQQHLQGLGKFSDLPRLNSDPSPSLIPTRKTSSSLASGSARVSPSELSLAAAKQGYPFPVSASTPGGLSTKSSYASLHTTSSGGNANNQSRVPVPKNRNPHASATSSDDTQNFSEIIPPVPAIPKGYDSPKDTEPYPFPQFSAGTASRKGSASHFPGSFDESVLDHEAALLGVPSYDFSRASMESERGKAGMKRKSTVANGISSTVSQPHLLSSAFDAGPASSPGYASSRVPQDSDGRQNGNLRLPPLNIMPLSNGSAANASRSAHVARKDVDEHDHPTTTGAQTPDWARRGYKTPSTPMTASKATFFKRHGDGDSKNGISMRSSTSHFGLRDTIGIEDTLRTGWLEDSDDAGVPIPGANRQMGNRAMAVSRNAITPFASGSLPKGSGEFARLHARPSGELSDDASFRMSLLDSARLAKTKSMDPRPSFSSAFGHSLSKDENNATAEPETPSGTTDKNSTKKEGALRRRLSLGWRRSSSKAANHSDNIKSADSEHTNAWNDITKNSSMLPPKLPASSAFTGDGSLGISTSARPSLDVNELGKQDLRRSTTAKAPQDDDDKTTSKLNTVLAAKTRSVHTERPQPVPDSRATSWNFNRPQTKSQLAQPRSSRHGHSASTISALVKDQDDLAADEEMRRLTQKKREVDNVAKQTEELMRRASPKDVLAVEHVLHDRHHSLNIFERGEIVEYEGEGVYFTGTKGAKKIVGSLAQSSFDPKKSDKGAQNGNYGYDDERGDYNIVLGDHLAYRYEVCDVLGKGSFGQVVRCIDHKEGGVVAVKIIRNKKRFHQQALVEVGILGKLREWDPDGAHATLSITSSFYFRSHLCIVTPCLSINLYELVRAHNFTGFNLTLIRRFARQLLACLILLQQKRVIHCDLKPENILLCSARAADIRVIDFGSSCREEEKVYTYIQSRFYRSPEVILGSSYGLGIDMWSFGCILAEMLTGFPIFPGENEQEQLACIMEIFGPPDRHLVERCTRKKLFFDSVGKPRVTVSSKGRRRRPSSKTLQQALKTDDEAFLDFVAKCLRWDPDRRMKPHEACNHPFITNQPMHQRPSIPDEARRTARVRSTAAVPTITSGPSPVKRTLPQPQGNITSSTPQKNGSGSRQVVETPQTAVRAPVASHGNAQSSPVKPVTNRRQSNIASAGGAAALASKRMSSGAALSNGATKTMSSGMGNLAEKAARESMASNSTAASSSSTGRWRV